MLALTRSLIVLAVLGAASAEFADMARAQEGCLEQIGSEQRARLQEQRISLNLRDASIPTTLRLLAQQYKLNMVVTDDVTGSITLDFFQVPAKDVFQAIIDAGRLDCAAVGGALRVSTSKRLKTEHDERVKADAEERRREADIQKAQSDARRSQEDAVAKRREDEAKYAEAEARGPVREETIRLKYADAEEIAKTIQGILGLPPQGATAPPVPLSQLSQLYVPSPPLEIPSTPPAPQTAAVPAVSSPPDVFAKGLTVQAYKPTNSVFIRYYSRDLERIKKLLQESLDIAVPQIQIAAQMVITTLNALEQIGIQWGGGVIGRSPVGGGTALVTQGFAQGPVRTGTGTPSSSGNFSSNSGFNASQLLPVDPATGLPVGGNLVNLPTSLLTTAALPAGGLLLGLIGSNFNINLAIQALEVQGKARTLAEPKAVTVENAKATISRGFEVPYTSSPTQGVSQVQFKDALLKLEVTPRLIKEDGETKIRMKVNFENNEPDFARASLTNGNPPIFKRKQETEVLIREGQRLVIGGVTNDTTAGSVRQVPLLGSIPVLGWLFKSRETSSSGEEMIVILTPSVISEPGAPPKR
jgi:type IV pilus assembly protein PilQ